jgi:L-phenylalanine/L-methionine N-acetyltransferase
MTITIRAAEPTDYAAICENMSQPIAQANTLQLPFPSLEVWKKRLAEFPVGDHLLVADLDGKVVGNLGLYAAAKQMRRRHVGAVGMAVHDAYHGRGVGSALMAAAIDLADNWLQYTRLELEVYVDNVAAIALYQKFGFVIEGTHPKDSFRHGVYIDCLSMGRLRSEKAPQKIAEKT